MVQFLDKAALAYGLKSPELVKARLRQMLQSGLYKGPINGTWDHNSRSAWEMYKKRRFGNNRALKNNGSTMSSKQNAHNEHESMGVGASIFNKIYGGITGKKVGTLGTMGGSLLVYGIPGLGSIASGVDAINAFRHGHFKEGLTDSLMSFTGLIPGLGLVGAGAKLAKAASAANKIYKAKNALKVSKAMNVAHGALTADMAFNMAPSLYKAGNQVYTGGKLLADTRKLYIDLAKKAGISLLQLQEMAKSDKTLNSILNSTSTWKGMGLIMDMMDSTQTAKNGGKFKYYGK